MYRELGRLEEAKSAYEKSISLANKNRAKFFNGSPQGLVAAKLLLSDFSHPGIPPMFLLMAARPFRLLVPQ